LLCCTSFARTLYAQDQKFFNQNSFNLHSYLCEFRYLESKCFARRIKIEGFILQSLFFESSILKAQSSMKLILQSTTSTLWALLYTNHTLLFVKKAAWCFALCEASTKYEMGTCFGTKKLLCKKVVLCKKYSTWYEVSKFVKYVFVK
jgi:hypothetical protein